MTEDPDGLAVLRACGVEVEKLRPDLTEFIVGEMGDLVVSKLGEPKPTAGFQRVVQRAAIHVQSSGREEVTGANVLVAIFSEREAHAVYFLQMYEMTRLDAVNYISHGIAKVPGYSKARNASDGEDIQEFYQEKYRVVKRIWNMHLYNMLYSTTNRNQINNVHQYAEQLVLGKEKFPKFILNKKEGENEHE